MAEINVIDAFPRVKEGVDVSSEIIFRERGKEEIRWEVWRMVNETLGWKGERWREVEVSREDLALVMTGREPARRWKLGVGGRWEMKLRGWGGEAKFGVGRTGGVRWDLVEKR